MSERSGRVGGNAILEGRDTADNADGALLSLIFAKGQRPDADAIAALSARGASGDGDVIGFAVSHRPPAADWLELLAQGMTFDCRGLAPGAPARLPDFGTLLGLAAMPEGEAVALLPGPHLAEGRGLLPVVRCIAALGAALAALPGLRAVCWEPAGSWMEPDYFRRVVADWRAGGAFPALGLTTLAQRPDGTMVSRGLDLLIGQELSLAPDRELTAAARAKIAVRLIHDLIGHGALTEPAEFIGPAGETLIVAPVDRGARLRVMVRR